MASNLMFCESSKKKLHLNESEGKSQKYILAGEFASLDGTPNRNGRIYTKDEYLKHLEYLRKDLKAKIPLLGELDHPDDRFEVKLKEASHRILDIWYDSASNTIQGKIELLDTPNGKLAQALVDDGVPLHISSRAAGSVNSDNTVSIQQIYTYDLVAKPGFANAVLHRVNESENTNKYTEDVNNFLKESARMESKNAAPQYGFLNENISVMEIASDVKLRKEAKDIKNNMINKVNEDEFIENPFFSREKWHNIIMDGIETENITKSNCAGAVEVPFEEIFDYAKQLYHIDFSDNADIRDIVLEVYREISNDYHGACNKQIAYANAKLEDASCGDASCGVSECGISEADDDEKEEEKEGEGDEEKEDEEKSEGVKINKVEGEFAGDFDEDIINDINAEFAGEEEGDEEKEDKEDSGSEDDEDENNECEKTVECGASCDKEEKEVTKANKLFDDEGRKSEEHKKDIDKIDELIAAIKKKKEEKESVKESVMAQFPALVNLNEGNFAAFMGLNESQKNNVIAYLRDNNIYSVESINESWKTGIEYKPVECAWLKYAPEEYRKLYEAASESVKNSLKATAECLIFENQLDVNNFWENSGLMESAVRKMNNDAFINSMPKIVTLNESEELPYGNDFIKNITAMACEYNAD